MPRKKNLLLPSYDQLLNLYNSYNYLGKDSVPFTAATLLLDKIMAEYLETDRNYVGLSSFWGYVAYKAISDLNNSNLVATKYKPALNLFFASSALGMIFKGKDFLTSGQNFNRTLKAATISAKLFESDKQEITKIEHAFSQDILSGFKEIKNNFSAILSNKFISNLLIKRSVNLAKLIIMEKFFDNISSNSKLSMYYAAQDPGGSKEVLKVLCFSLFKSLINSGEQYFFTKILSMNNDLSMKIAELRLDQKAANTVMKLGSDVQSFSLDINSVISNVNGEVEKLFQNLIVPYIYSRDIIESDNLSDFVKKYSSLILLENAMSCVFSFSNMNEFYNYIENNYLKDQDHKKPEKEQQPGVVVIKNVLAGNNQGYWEQRFTVEDYTTDHIQDITKFGSNDFILSQTQKYINSKKLSNTELSRTLLSNTISFMQKFVKDMTFFTLLPSLDISSPKDILQIETSSTKINSIIDRDNSNSVAVNSPDITMDDILRCENTYNALINPLTKGIAARDLEKDATLTIKNYYLQKILEPTNLQDIYRQKEAFPDKAIKLCLEQLPKEKEMLYIDNLFLNSGIVYAISGKTGLGKTTFLSDIAKCLDSSVFESFGTIHYPTFNGKEMPMIFCGTETFDPPGSTLFERLTYRLPEDYVTTHKNGLSNEILQLFERFQQRDFSEETLDKKNFKCSTGQDKAIILIPAIIYKHYLNSPVLFAIDETLANFDPKTSKFIGKIIKSEFNDSIILSVDHQWEYNPNFYDENIDLNLCALDNQGMNLAGDIADSLVVDI